MSGRQTASGCFRRARDQVWRRSGRRVADAKVHFSPFAPSWPRASGILGEDRDGRCAGGCRNGETTCFRRQRQAGGCEGGLAQESGCAECRGVATGRTERDGADAEGGAGDIRVVQPRSAAGDRVRQREATSQARAAGVRPASRWDEQREGRSRPSYGSNKDY